MDYTNTGIILNDCSIAQELSAQSQLFIPWLTDADLFPGNLVLQKISEPQIQARHFASYLSSETKRALRANACWKICLHLSETI